MAENLLDQSSSFTLAALCARALDSLKAEHILALDLRSIDSSPTDYFLICTANSDTHARALTDALARATLNLGVSRPRTEGRDVGEWVLLDYFDVVVHIFRRDAREYYKLEKLWGDAPSLDIQALLQALEKPAKTPAASAKSKAKATTSVKKSATPKPAKEKTVKEKIVKEKATKEKPVKEKAVKEKPVKEKTVKEKAVKEKTTKEKSAQTTAAKPAARAKAKSPKESGE
jgi:ribosome-associated protein